MTLRIGLAALAVSTLGLAACGGDGAGAQGSGATPPVGPPPFTTGKAEGAYSGATSRGFELFMLVLEDDEGWLFDQSGDVLTGFVRGAGSSNNGSYTMTGASDFDFVDDVVTAASVSATYTPGVSINGTITPSGADVVSFTATAAAVVGYDYKQAASLPAIEGSWNGFFNATDQTGTVSITNVGAISGTIGATGSPIVRFCSFGGTLAPRASGKNVFDVQLTFGGTPCALANQTASGIAIVSEPVAGRQQLLWAVTNAARDGAVSFIGQR